ncbi:MAG: hypothetical protein ACI9DK_000376 [Vicingaceae bacterium]|jgi:hypothetical protein
MKAFLVLSFFIVSTLSYGQQFQRFGQTPLEGYYWDFQGNKHEGKLQVYCTTQMGAGTTIKFLETGNKKQKLTKKQVKSFVMGSDSFALIQNFSPSKLAYYSADFAKVVKVGAINLYLHKRRVTQSTGYYGTGMGTGFANILTETYVVRKNGRYSYIAIFNKKSFTDSFLPLIADFPVLHAKASAMKPRKRLSSLWSLIREYNDFKIE